MQGCDFDALLKKSGLPKLIDFYKAHGIKVELRDFRQYQSKFNVNKVIVDKKYNDAKGTVVHMGAKSQHMGSQSNGIYQVSDYDKADTALFHHDAVHDYEINRDILQADVIINFCKPKTHRLAGITGAMKNMVGITYLSHYNFHRWEYLEGKRTTKCSYVPTIYRYSEGSVFKVELKNHTIEQSEIAYVHFQKRKVIFPQTVMSQYLLVPNKIIADEPLTEEKMQVFCKDNWKYTLEKKCDRIVRAVKCRLPQ